MNQWLRSTFGSSCDQMGLSEAICIVLIAGGVWLKSSPHEYYAGTVPEKTAVASSSSDTKPSCAQCECAPCVCQYDAPAVHWGSFGAGVTTVATSLTALYSCSQRYSHRATDVQDSHSHSQVVEDRRAPAGRALRAPSRTHR